MTRLRKINKAVKSYDRELFAKREGPTVVIYRRCKEWKSYDLGNGVTITDLFINPWRVISLTENWSVNTQPVDWGLDVIVNRLKAIDLWNSGMTADDLKELDEKWEASRERDRQNTIESFLYDFRSAFKKSTNDVNTSLMNKVDKRRM